VSAGPQRGRPQGGGGLREAVIVAALRTPVGRGRPGGALSGWHPVDLLAETFAQLVDRSGVDPERIDDVIVGCVSQAGQQTFNIARNAVLAAGLPESVPATTVDRQCGSSQQALHFAAQGVIAGAYDVALVGGVESMSRVPMGSSLGGEDPFGTRIAARYPGGLVPQGISAELIAARWGLDRTELDAYSAESHRRAAAAADEGRTGTRVLDLPVDRGEGPTGERLTRDEGIRADTSVTTLAALRPAFEHPSWRERFPELGWVIHAGNASQLSDGAAALLVMERGVAERGGFAPLARVHAMTVVGDDPLLMLTGVIPATRRVLERAGLGIDDIDAFEVNEAFAPVVLAWQRETGADLARVNVNGGAIATGHPLGASGAKLMTTLIDVLEHTGGRFGLQTMCEGGGMANATIIERLP
jgi:acetyl-CoA acyltransferase